eukprot:907174-Pyramimonas_sp.AAC.1
METMLVVLAMRSVHGCSTSDPTPRNSTITKNARILPPVGKIAPLFSKPISTGRPRLSNTNEGGGPKNAERKPCGAS